VSLGADWVWVKQFDPGVGSLGISRAAADVRRLTELNGTTGIPLIGLEPFSATKIHMDYGWTGRPGGGVSHYLIKN
jgi:hypothetical protein